jgi:hypothetical protein
MPLVLKAGSPPIAHRLESAIAVQVGPNRFENRTAAVVKQTLVSKAADGYVIAVEVLDFQQQATDLFSQVTADLNQLSQRVVVRTDAHGCLAQVLNVPELTQQWVRLRPTLHQKYAGQPAVRPFLDSFEQQLSVPGTFEQSLRNKGIYGALFPGLYGQPLSSEQGSSSHRQLHNFFNQLHLPLLLTTLASPNRTTSLADELRLTTTGQLDEAQFDALAFQRMMQSIVDDVTFPVTLELDHTETYTVDLASGWITRGVQALTAQVPGAYFQESRHEISPLSEAP